MKKCLRILLLLSVMLLLTAAVSAMQIRYETQRMDEMTEALFSERMDAMKSLIAQRLKALSYQNATVALDGNACIVVTIPEVVEAGDLPQKLIAQSVLELRDADNQVVLTGSDIRGAQAVLDVTDASGQFKPHVKLQFTAAGREKFAEASKRAAGRGDGKNYIGIYLDDELISQPYVDASNALSGIYSESIIITLGKYATMDGAKYLADILSLGAQPLVFTCTVTQAESGSPQTAALQIALVAGLLPLPFLL